MQYLVASVEPKSKAERLILSFPATAANYPKAVDQLKKRFGREDLLVQIYVRDLLTMVMKNAVSGRAKTDLSRLYDELEGKLRALESLGQRRKEVLSEEKICDSVPKITDEQILNNLRELNIEFSDSFSEDLGIDLLVGSNVLGRILMKKYCELDSGLSVVETKLGNTVIGMQDDVCHIDRNVMTTLSMYVRNFKLTDLWSLESLGISNPTLEESKQNSYEDALNDFQQKLAILPNGRYELQLPWKHDPVNLPDNKGLTWARHEKVIKRAEKVTVPRYIAINETSELHIFVDASKSSYGACVFVRTVVENDLKVTLLRSKARVAPLKSLTIPRLELMSCCLGARLANSIIRALNLPGIKVIYWSDSEVALWWIREQGNWSVLVANRMLDSKWWEGPRWLRNNREQWPANEINCEPKDVILEKRKSELVNINISEELVPWVHVEERELSELSSDDIENAERVLIRSNSPMSEPVSLPADRVKDANAFDITGKAILTYEELLTVLCDCEAVVNSRPLTYVSEDPNDLIPLTPSLFLNGKSSYDTVDLDLSEFSKFQKRIKYRRKLIHDFRSRFRKEYLGQLRQKRPGKPGHDFKVGDVVMIEEPSKKRVYWPLGKVISLLPGRDGKSSYLEIKMIEPFKTLLCLSNVFWAPDSKLRLTQPHNFEPKSDDEIDTYTCISLFSHTKANP
ncbi:integrase catalytic domain-containing protein [Trichonephila clavipes]|nr:integrase catalytic domain-containing protein [Trichonephila clavipes]